MAALPLVFTLPTSTFLGGQSIPPGSQTASYNPTRVSVDPTLTTWSATHNYRVKAGDTLSSIAAREYGSARDWSSVWFENRHKVKNPNSIQPGDKLKISWHPKHGAWLTRRALDAIPKPQPTQHTVRHTYHAPAQNTQQAAPVVSGTGYAATAFGACVRQAENGGSYAWGTGNGGGAYQFLLSTWEAHGGSPADYGSAGPAAQDQVFNNTVAADGDGDWAPYDGCTL